MRDFTPIYSTISGTSAAGPPPLPLASLSFFETCLFEFCAGGPCLRIFIPMKLVPCCTFWLLPPGLILIRLLPRSGGEVLCDY